MGNASSKSQRYMQQRERTNTEHRKSGKLAMNLVREEFNRDIQEVYDLRSGELLGKGGFGTVRVVTHKETRKKFALKTIELKDVETHEQYEFLLNEIEIMKKLDHPNIARVQEVFHTPDHYYMVMDLYTGGDMYARYKFRSEADTAKIVGKLINALRYCHDRNVAHRDIKLENICFESEAEDAEVKLVDFGLSASFKEEQLRHDLVGSWAFMAPEVLQRAHHPQACDMWSMGVITYCLLAGYPPFRSVNLKGLKEQILHTKVLFEGDAWRSVSNVAKDFILRLLKKDPSKRLTAQQAQQHPWLQTRVRKEGRNPKLSPEVIENLVRFKNLNLMKRLALGVVARTLEASDMRNLEQEFHKADVEEKGVVSIEDFRAVLLRSGQFQAKDVDDIFSLVDIDNSGELSYTDFTAAALSLHQLDTRRLKYAFERLDNDSNGEIDYEDLLMIVGSDLSSEEIRIAIKQFDTKGNGRVTFEDFCKGMRSAGGGGALDALATAQLTSRYMVDSIKKGEGQAAIKTALTEIEMCSSDVLSGIPEPGERALGVSASGEATAAGPSVATSVYQDIGASVSSSAGTAELSRTQSLENESGNFSRSHATGVLGAADAGGGIEAAAPPQPGSEGRPAAGGARVDAGPAGADPTPTTPTIIIPPGDAWGEAMRGSLAERRMRDSIKLRGAMHGGVVPGPLGFATSPGVRSTPLTNAAVDAAAAGSAGVAAPRHAGGNLAGPGVRGAKEAGALLPPKPSKAGTPTARVGARGNGQAPLPPQHEQHLPAPASARSGGDPAAGGQAGGNADRNGKNVKRKVIEPAADLPPKDSTADPADLGWGPDGPPADLMGPTDDSTEGSSTGTARGGLRKNGVSRNSGSPQSLRFGGVSDDGLPSRGKAKRDRRKGIGTGGIVGAATRRTGGAGVHGGYDARGQGWYGRRDSDDTCCGPENNGALFCVPGDGSVSHMKKAVMVEHAPQPACCSEYSVEQCCTTLCVSCEGSASTGGGPLESVVEA